MRSVLEVDAEQKIREFAAEKLGYRKVPVIIRAMKDDEAVVSMVDFNLERERISRWECRQ